MKAFERSKNLTVAAAAVSLIGAATPAAYAQGVTDKNATLTRQNLPLPAAGVPVTEPVFGTTIVRLTDRTNSGGYATQIYSQLQAFSDDNAYVLLNEDDEFVVRRMADRSLLPGLGGIVWNAPRWQPAAPRTLVHYDTNGDTTVRVQYTTVDPVSTTTVYTFPSIYDRVLPNQSFDEISQDGRWMAGMLVRNDNAGVIFALDLDGPTLGATIAIPDLYAGPCTPDPQWGELEPDWVGVSPLGNWIVVQWARDGTDRCSGLETFDPVTGAFVGRVYDGHQHGDLGVHTNGTDEFFMTFELSSPMNPNQPAVGYRDLPGTATVSQPVYLTSLAWGGGHISCQGPAGVCLVSYGSWPGDGWTPFETEEFLQYTDGSVLRLAHHRSSECGYWVQPRGSLSRDGSRAIFASDWAAEGGGDSCGGEPLGEGEAFVIELGPGAQCGDGTVEGTETCDDGNTASGDGCDANCTPTGCGNGVVTAGESCDDGNTVGGDCCSATCVADAPGTDCDDGDVCNGTATCDAAGACVATAPLDCDDGDPCTADSCDALLGCSSVSALEAVCSDAAVGDLKILDKTGTRDRVIWKWRGAGNAAAFADPLAGDDYALCVWETAGGVPASVLAMEIPAGAGWRATGNGFKYRSASGAPDGATGIKLKAAANGQAKLLLKAAGANLALPGPVNATDYLSVDPNVTAQLRNQSGACWDLELPEARRNDPTRFDGAVR